MSENKEYSYWGKQYLIRKLKAINYLGKKCKQCGYDKYHGALEFHHRDPNQKELVWKHLKKRSWNNIKLELDKCDLLCANCHREEHQNDQYLLDVLKWREKVDSFNKLTERKCKYCNKTFKPYANKLKYCSVKCYNLDRKTKIKWPKNLPELVEKSSQRAVARKLGVSDKAVEKRLKNHH